MHCVEIFSDWVSSDSSEEQGELFRYRRKGDCESGKEGNMMEYFGIYKINFR